MTSEISLEPTCAPPVEHPSKPKLKLLPLACDSHCHIFGPHARFPYAPKRTFTPHDAPKERLRALHDFLGFERTLIVQSSCHGTDHSAVLDALKAWPGRCRGVALLAPDTPKAEVVKLHEAGMRGVRLHFLPHLGPSQTPDEIREILALVAPFGWHIAIHVTGKDLLAVLDLIRSIKAPVVIDHIARVDVSEGADGEAFKTLRALLDGGNVWVKLSGIDRVSKQPPPFRDAVALARILAEQAPERVVWGTDFPHPNTHGGYVPDDGVLVDMIEEIAPTARARQLMLVDNPAKVFDFT